MKRAAIGALALAIVGAILWLASRAMSLEGDRVTLSTAVVPTSHVAEADDSSLLPASAASTAHSLAGKRRTPAADEIDVCDVGIVKRADLERSEFTAKVFPEPKKKRNQWIANMRSRPDDSVRATGHYLAAVFAWAPEKESLRERFEACTSDRKCEIGINEIHDALFGAPVSSHEVDALVDDATTTGNPFVYAMAVQICGAWDATRSRGRCQLITLERWAQVDPDNATPWLFLADAADKQGDAAGRREALYRASTASMIRTAGQQLLALAELSLPNDVGEFDRLRLHIDVAGVAAAWAFPPFQQITRYCTAEALRDANVHQICDGLASVLADRGETLIERGISIGLAERVGWAPERIAAMKTERDAFYQVAVWPQPDSWDCASLEQQNGRFANRSRLGELAFTRQLVAESKQSVDALAKQYAEQSRATAEAGAKIMEAAIASAAAASAASAAEAAHR